MREEILSLSDRLDLTCRHLPGSLWLALPSQQVGVCDAELQSGTGVINGAKCETSMKISSLAQLFLLCLSSVPV